MLFCVWRGVFPGNGMYFLIRILCQCTHLFCIGSLVARAASEKRQT